MIAIRKKKSSTLLRVVTNSEAESFACERLWWFRYVEGLTPFNSPAPLRQGSLVGRGIEAWARSGSTMTFDEIERDVIAPWWEQRISLFREGRIDDETMAKDSEIRAESRAMLAGYVRQWEGDAEEWETIAVEAQVARWLVHPGTGDRPVVDRPLDGRDVPEGEKAKRARRRWAFGGKIDRLVRSRSTQRVWLMETKTTKETNLDKFVRKLHFDPQVRGYAWALANPSVDLTDGQLVRFMGENVAEHTGQIRVEGVIYDVLRKVTPEIPKPIKDGSRLQKASTLTCDRQTYLDAILRHGWDPDSEEYRPQLEALAAQRFFQREAYPFTEREIEDFGTDAAWRALSMLDAERRPFHPRQTRVCTGVNRGCPGGYESICMEDGAMARKSFRLLTIRHTELTGDLAEPWVGGARALRSPLPFVEREAEPAPPPDAFAPVDPHARPDGGDLFSDAPLTLDQGARTVTARAAPAAEERELDPEDAQHADLFGPPAHDDGEAG